MGYMRTATVYINEGHPLFKYADNLTALTNNLSNAARFRQRQVLSAVSKEEADWTANEREVMEEIRKTVPLREKASMPTKGKHLQQNDSCTRERADPPYRGKVCPRCSVSRCNKQKKRPDL